MCEELESKLVTLLDEIEKIEDYLLDWNQGEREDELLVLQLKYMRLYAGVMEERLL